MKKAVVIIVVLLIVAAGAFFIFSSNNRGNTSSNSQANTSSNSQDNAELIKYVQNAYDACRDSDDSGMEEYFGYSLIKMYRRANIYHYDSLDNLSAYLGETTRKDMVKIIPELPQSGYIILFEFLNVVIENEDGKVVWCQNINKAERAVRQFNKINDEYTSNGKPWDDEYWKVVEETTPLIEISLVCSEIQVPINWANEAGGLKKTTSSLPTENEWFKIPESILDKLQISEKLKEMINESLPSH